MCKTCRREQVITRRPTPPRSKGMLRATKANARFGRLYIAWEREAGLYSVEWLTNLVFDARTVRVIDRLIKIVDVLYQRFEQRFPAAARLV